MSILYPRLLDQAARDLYEEYVEMDVTELTARVSFSHPSAIFTATGGSRAAPTQLQELRDTIVAVAEEARFPYPGTREGHAEFDLRVARILHEKSGLVPAEAAVRAAWAFLALVVMPDVAFWRYRRAPGDRVLATDITRHVFGRLWWRAHLLEDPTALDRYELLNTFGEADFDQIFSRRKSLGGSREIVRALARTWPRLPTRGRNERGLLRQVLMRLLRLGTITEFESLEEAELNDLVTAVALEATSALDAAS